MFDGNLAITCPRCGARVAGVEGCFALRAELSAREYSDPAYGAVNLLTTDAHALQHPEDHGIKNNAFHLVRLGWLLEHRADPRIGNNPRWLHTPFDGLPDLPTLTPPSFRGHFTAVDMLEADTPEQYRELAYTWGRSVWEAWSQHHDWARGFLKAILP
jgi:hypothetical protein